MARSPAAQLHLGHLRLIAAIAEHRQLSVAAQALAMTQPAASRTLAEAEARLATALFERHARGMTLTDVGESLARRARNVVDELNLASDEVDRLRRGRGGVVRLGAVSGAAVGYVVPAIRSLRAAAPEVEVHVEVGTSEDLLTGLLARRLDMVLGRVPPRLARDGLALFPARGEEVCIVARARHPAATGVPVALAELASSDWVMQAPGAPIRQAVEAAFVAQGAALPRSVVNSASLLIALAMMDDARVVTPLSREVADLVTGRRSDLVVLPLDRRIEVAPYSLVTLADRRPSQVAARWHALLVEMLAGTGPPGDGAAAIRPPSPA
jgi:DNA-binding transcriptional LysR family regulator